MEYLHTMVRISNVEESLDFYCNKLGMVEVRRTESEAGRYTNIFLSAPGDAESAKENWSPTIELTFNWDPEQYTGGRNFGHLAFQVDNIYELPNIMDEAFTIAITGKPGAVHIDLPKCITMSKLIRNINYEQQ